MACALLCWIVNKWPAIKSILELEVYYYPLDNGAAMMAASDFVRVPVGAGWLVDAVQVARNSIDLALSSLLAAIRWNRHLVEAVTEKGNHREVIRTTEIFSSPKWYQKNENTSILLHVTKGWHWQPLKEKSYSSKLESPRLLLRKHHVKIQRENSVISLTSISPFGWRDRHKIFGSERYNFLLQWLVMQIIAYNPYIPMTIAALSWLFEWICK